MARMEFHITWDAIVGATLLDAVIRLLWAVIGAGLTTLGFWGLRRRVKALENRQDSAQPAQPAITQTITFHGDVNVALHDRHLKEAIEEKTAQNLRETIRDLPQNTLAGGHTYATLPNGTNIVTMADGTMRLAVPISLSAAFEGGLDGSLSASIGLEGDANLSETRTNWRANPGAGRTAAKLIAKVATFDEAREIWDAFYNAPRRTEMNWAYWAFVSLLEETGRGKEIPDLTLALCEEGEDIDPDDEIMGTIKRWQNEARKSHDG